MSWNSGKGFALAKKSAKALLSLLERVPLSGDIARLAGEMRREIGLDKLSLPDAAIAATAVHLGHT